MSPARRAGKVGGDARRRGSAIVEFALVLPVFLLFLLGAIEMGRVLFTYNSAVEATRLGARTAVVSAVPADAAVLAQMQTILPDLSSATVQVSYLPAGCTSADCAYVEVGLQGYTVTPLLWPLSPITLPALTTTLPAESLGDN
jgi:Flp pilus assembly protein TadG